jgi:hypothetical protein
MEESILISTKKILGIDAAYDAFDLDVITHINAAFSALYQLGVGPDTGFSIEDDTKVWDDFISGDEVIVNACKTYVYLRVRILFDPPMTSFVLTALKEQLQEYEWRINILRETTDWVAPTEKVV